MKMQVMASLLVHGDIIIDNRCKYKVINVAIKDQDATILYQPLKKHATQAIKRVKRNEFLNVISAI